MGDGGSQVSQNIKLAQPGGPGRGRGDGRGRVGRGAGRGRGGAAASPEAAKNPLEPHGRVWTEIQSKERETEGFMAPQKASLKWPHTCCKLFMDRTPLDYFSLFHPRTSLSKMVSFANLQIAKSIHPEPSTTLGEITKFLGIRVAMVIDPVRGGLRDYWNAGNEEKSVIMSRDFGTRFGMTKHRFEILQENFVLCEPEAEGLAFDERVRLIANYIAIYHTRYFVININTMQLTKKTKK